MDIRSRLFRCPNCAALYQVTRAESDPARNREIICLTCGGPLDAREGKFALKYLFLRPRSESDHRRERRRRRARKGGNATAVE